jgi:hypothetical protein
MIAPQSVTERYVSNLLRDGQNADFTITKLESTPVIIEGVHCGLFFTAHIDAMSAGITAVGPTPSSALRNALTKFGVTFR